MTEKNHYVIDRKNHIHSDWPKIHINDSPQIDIKSMQFASFNADTILSEFNQPPPEPSSKSNANNPIVSVPRLPIHESIVHRLDQFISKNQIPHIIFHGPSGSGKLTLVREFISKIYSGDKVKIKTHVMTVNCSHGKGIQFIREEIKFFAKANAQTKSAGDFKIILLLNAHHLTVDAQSALRRCIELFSYNTRFFIVVENKNKLLNPILSRFCDVFVPEPVHPITRETVNLHQYVLSQQFTEFREDLVSGANPERRRRAGYRREPTLIAQAVEDLSSQVNETVFDSLNRDLTTKEKMEIVNRLVESGISCLDFMEWVKKRRDRWSPLEHSRATMTFYQIKPQFRCEKLLMLFMVNFLY